VFVVSGCLPLLIGGDGWAEPAAGLEPGPRWGHEVDEIVGLNQRGILVHKAALDG